MPSKRHALLLLPLLFLGVDSTEAVAAKAKKAKPEATSAPAAASACDDFYGQADAD